MSFCNFLLTCLTNPAKIKKKKKFSFVVFVCMLFSRITFFIVYQSNGGSLYIKLFIVDVGK